LTLETRARSHVVATDRRTARAAAPTETARQPGISMQNYVLTVRIQIQKSEFQRASKQIDAAFKEIDGR
jgi:hypothetical protein